MRTLRIEGGGKLYVGGELVYLSQIENKSEFLSSLLTLDLELADGIILSDLIHFFYESRDLIRSILSEEYEVVRALVTTTNLPRPYSKIRIFKSFNIEKEIEEDGQEFIYLIPEIEIVPSIPGEDGINTLSSLSVVIDENITFNHRESETTINTKTKINLLDLMTCLFEDLSSLLKQGALLY